jgi:hypothetical protein
MIPPDNTSDRWPSAAQPTMVGREICDSTRMSEPVVLVWAIEIKRASRVPKLSTWYALTKLMF